MNFDEENAANSKTTANRFCEFFSSYVSKIYVEQQLRTLKRGKSAGHDDIPPGMLKDAAHQLAKPLSAIINLSLQTGIGTKMPR